MFPHSTVESTALRSKSMHNSTSGLIKNFAEPIYVEYILPFILVLYCLRTIFSSCYDCWIPVAV